MNIQISSEEVNALICQYLEERGLSHTAFALKAETDIKSLPEKPGLLVQNIYRGLLMN